jgi:hypothetical protein
MIRDAVERRERADLDVSSRPCFVLAAGCQLKTIYQLGALAQVRESNCVA